MRKFRIESNTMRTISPTLIRRCLAAGTASLLSIGGVAAQNAPQADSALLASGARINGGSLPYRATFDMQQLLTSYQPPEPRIIDLTLRLAPEDPADLAPAATQAEPLLATVVGATLNHPLAVSRAGYFLLPYLEWAHQERATIAFNAPTLSNQLQTAWKIRLAPDQTLSYADFGRALGEMKLVQKNIPWYRFGLRQVRKSSQDGLKACFVDRDGRIEIDGQVAATTIETGCQVLAFDAARAAQAGAIITFVGTLDTVTLHDAVK